MKGVGERGVVGGRNITSNLILVYMWFIYRDGVVKVLSREYAINMIMAGSWTTLIPNIILK
jgi:hypothetical protein